MRLLHCATPRIALAVASDGQAGCAVERESSDAGHAGENGPCAWPPAARAAEGATEGNDHTIAGFGQSVINASAGGRGFASGTAYTTGTGFGVPSRRYCTVNVVMSGGEDQPVELLGADGRDRRSTRSKWALRRIQRGSANRWKAS